MKTKFLLTNIILFAVMLTSANAQTYGKWVGATSNFFWEYNLGAGTGSQTAGAAAQSWISTSESASFLPSPPSGSVRAALTGSNVGGSISYGSDRLNIVASNGSTPHKFSVYGIAAATAVTSFFFTLDFNNTTATNGLIIIGIGNSSGSIYTNSSQLSGASAQTNLFTALRFNAGASGISAIYRVKNPTPPDAYVYATAYVSGSSNVLSKAGAHQVEVYVNNANSSQSYVREGVIYSVQPRAFHYWIDGARLTTNTDNDDYDFAGTDEGTAGQAVDAMVVTAAGSTNPSANALSASFSNIKLGQIEQSVLPVNLIGFTAQKQGSGVQLNWSTASELNNNYFELSRSVNNANNFKPIHKTLGSGTANAVKKYSYIDYSPLSGTNYYQLKQVDNNGDVRGTWVTAVNVELKKATLTGFINNHKQLQISYNTATGSNATLFVTDLNGVNIITKPIILSKGNNIQQLDVSSLNSGVYVVTLVEPNYKGSIKIGL